MVGKGRRNPFHYLQRNGCGDLGWLGASCGEGYIESASQVESQITKLSPRLACAKALPMPTNNNNGILKERLSAYILFENKSYHNSFCQKHNLA